MVSRAQELPLGTLESVGKRLKAWRKGAGMTLVDVSKIIGTSQAALSEMENSKSLPSAVTLINFNFKTNLGRYLMIKSPKSSFLLCNYHIKKTFQKILNNDN